VGYIKAADGMENTTKRMKEAALLALVAILLLLVTGCAGDWTRMDCSQATVKTATITWERTDDPAVTCAELGASTLKRGGACISVARDGNYATARLYAEGPGEIDDVILGHEVKHAFGCKHA